MKDSNLYQAIESFELNDSEANFPFEKRLARENNWSLDFALRAIKEYKRFIYLCMTSDQPCTPSDEVDQVWHLHMLYTNSYFNRLCGEILGRTLSHEPTKGGTKEGEKFNDWYTTTLNSYTHEFGESPPLDIWPGNELRFKNPGNFKRIDTSKYFIISKNSLRKISICSGIGVVSLVGIGCATTTESRSRELNQFLTVFAIVLLVGVLIYWFVKWVIAYRKDNPGGCGGSGCASSGCSSDSGSGCSSGCGGGGCGGCGS